MQISRATSVIVATLSALTTAVSLVFLWFNLTEARLTTRAALRDVEMSEKSYLETKANYARDQRAWLSFGVPDLKRNQLMALSPQEPLVYFTFSIEVRNTGRSPAFGVIVHRNSNSSLEYSRSVPESDETMASLIQGKRDLSWGGFVIAPGETRTELVDVTIAQERFAPPYHEMLFPAVSLIIEYGTVGDNETRFTQEHFRLLPDVNNPNMEGLFIPAASEWQKNGFLKSYGSKMT